MVIKYRKKMLRLAQIWFEPVPAGRTAGTEKGTDIAFYHQVEKPVSGLFAISRPFHTQVSDLTLPGEELFSQISKTERYQIRKNMRDDVTVENWDSPSLLEHPEVLEGLAEMFEAMYASKNTPKTMNREQILQYAKAGGLFVTCVKKDGEALVYHSYTMDEKNARLLHSVSDFREREDASLIARSNKRLHWADMELFSSMGIEVYDWGGISSLEKPNGIDSFKMKFGGQLVTRYNVFLGRTILGKLAILALKIKGF